MKSAGQRIYNNDTPPLGFLIVSIDTTTNIAQIDADPPGPDPNQTTDPNNPNNSISGSSPLNTRLLYTELEANLLGVTPPVVGPPNLSSTGASGVQVVQYRSAWEQRPGGRTVRAALFGRQRRPGTDGEFPR